MSTINMDAQKGSLMKATEVPSADATANRFGRLVPRAIDTSKVQDGAFGNFSGDLAAANTQMEQAKQIAPLVNDAILRAQNLQIAEEDAKKSLYHLDWQTAEREARQAAKDAAAEKQLDTDGEHEAYKTELANRTAAVNDKYTFYTRVGNDIEARRDAWTRTAESNYITDVVEPRRVEAVKASAFQALTGWSKSLSDQLAQEADPLKVAKSLSENKTAVQTFLRQPQMVAVFGADRAEQLITKTVDGMFLDSVSAMTSQNPEGIVKLLRNNTGDPATDPFFELDPSMRRQVLYQAEKELANRKAEEKAKVKEQQDKNEVELTLGIITGKLSGNGAIATVYKMYQDGLIDQSHVERAMTKIQMQADRAERRAEAAAARNERAREREHTFRQPVVDSFETGLPLDPNNAQHVKSVNHVAASILQNVPRDKQEKEMTKLIQTTGVIPNHVTGQLYGLVNSSDSKEVKRGVALYNSLSAMVPGAAKSFNESTNMKISQINYGVSPEQAQLNVDQAKKYSPEQKTEMRKPISANPVKINKAVGEAFGVSPANVPSEVKGAVRDLLKDHIVAAGGDMDIALKMTTDAIKMTYGVSTLTGKPKIMYNPPEGMNGATPWMNAQLESSLKDLGVKPEQVRLVSNAHGNWDLIGLNDKGVPVGYLTDKDTGKKLSWTPDYEQNMKEQRAKYEEATKKRNEELIKNAEVERKKFIEKQRIEEYNKAHKAPTSQQVYKNAFSFGKE